MPFATSLFSSTKKSLIYGIVPKIFCSSQIGTVPLSGRKGLYQTYSRDGIQEGGHEKRSHWSKRCCSKVFCKISADRIGFRVGFQLGIFKPAFPPRERRIRFPPKERRRIKKNAHMNHGLAAMKKVIRMPSCLPHISVKKEIKLA